jgi:(p)ppGpp synthase/HD superfamily hydrolase
MSTPSICRRAFRIPSVKPEWRPRKERYLAHLDRATDDVLLVSAADKLHNARAILTDLKEVGSALWDRFTGGRSGTLWYYRSLVQAYRSAARDRRLVEDLDNVVSEIERRASGTDSSAPDPYEIH